MADPEWWKLAEEALRLLPLWDRACPEDRRPHQALVAAGLYQNDPALDRYVALVSATYDVHHAWNQAFTQEEEDRVPWGAVSVAEAIWDLCSHIILPGIADWLTAAREDLQDAASALGT